MAKRSKATARDTVELEAPAPRVMRWDERRRLAYDIANLSPPDLPGVLLLVERNKRAKLTCHEYPPEPISAWDAYADAIGADRTPQPEASHRIQMDCTFDLDSAEPELLQQLRTYVDNCHIPHYLPRENCSICEGLWSTGRVIACGNDACDTKIHEECFGVVLRPDAQGPWLCPTCLLGRQLTCAVCMQTGGALKPLASAASNKDGSSVSIDELKWVHVLCALAIPELTMRDVPALEPVDGLDEIENSRFRYLCGICRKRGGASVICEQENCNVGMHPLCAANAGFMVGTDAKPLGVYCDKHLPMTRIPGAKRWISDEDLVEEIMSDNSVDDDTERYLAQHDHLNTMRHAFILETTSGYHELAKLAGLASALRWGGVPKIRSKSDTKASAYNSVKINPHAWTCPGIVVVGSKTRRPLVFPPQDHDRVGLPAFPQADDLVGAIVDFLLKDQDEWVRARVLEWDTTRQLHLLHIVANDHKIWAKLATSNTLILYLPEEERELDGPCVKLYRPTPRRGGSAEWRPKPRKFAGNAQT
jgi:NuA3 HAT complex component NTO1